MSSYIQVIDGWYDDKRWWNNLVRACAIVGDSFEIHCWSDERAEALAALRFGQKVRTSWDGGTVIRGRITKDFLAFLTESSKPSDTEIYNKMTPFFTIMFGNQFQSAHYGTEVIIPKLVRQKKPAIDQVLDQLSDIAVVHRNVG